MLTLNDRHARGFISDDEVDALSAQMALAVDTLDERRGPGDAFLGWVDWPETMSDDDCSRIEDVARTLRERSDVFIVIGIGGSYLGARAVIEALSEPHAHIGSFAPGRPAVVFAGHHLSSRALAAVEHLIDRYEVSVNVISKSGTTTEPAIAFRRIKAKMDAKYGAADAATRIVATTDRSHGALRRVADEAGYVTFVVPDDIGGRYSVLTPVGLLPIAVAGFDVRALLGGAKAARHATLGRPWRDDIAARYALFRNLFLRKRYMVEALVSYEPSLHYVGEWWKQLFGESEGKFGRGLMPTSLDFTTDLHSMGQFVQDGRRLLFETVLAVLESPCTIPMTTETDDADGLNYLAGKTLHEVNQVAREATTLAHVSGGVPNLTLELERLDEAHLGYLFYVFERACALSGYLNAVNPFDQPGVEAYKRTMFAMLGKPGYEAYTPTT